MDGIADKPRQRSDLVVQELDGEALLYDPLAHLLHRLNDTGFLIWRLCDGRRSVDEIAALLTESYDVGWDAARQDVAQAIEQMADNLILESPLTAEHS